MKKATLRLHGRLAPALILALLAAPLPAGAGAAQHPVFPPAYTASQVNSLKSQVAPFIAMTLDEITSMVPTASGIYFCGCPKCDGGSQESGIFDWDPSLGDKVRCKFCSTVLPNAEFPNNREKTIVAPGGRVQVYRWHQNSAGRQYFLEPHAWYERMTWLRAGAVKMANIYHHTGDTAYGDRAAAITARFAQVVPGYPVRFDYPFRPVQFFPADQKWPYAGMVAYRGAKFSWWAYLDIPDDLGRVYDLLAARGYDYSRLGASFGPDPAAMIRADLLRLMYDFTAANPETYSNMSPSTYRGMIVIGRLLDEPAIVHDTVDRFRGLLAKQFFFDGWWSEGSPAYHNQTVGGLTQVADVAAGYSDPPSWSGERFEQLDLLSDAPQYGKALAVGKGAILPNGRWLPINDSWHYNKSAATAATTSRLWPGLGNAVLGAGSGTTQFALNLNWSGNYGHSHMDNGSILLFAFGHELLSDIGYTHTRYRNWTINSASHNMVVVNETSQLMTAAGGKPTTGDLLFYDDRDPRVRVIDVDAPAGYAATSVYRRRLVHVNVAAGRDYVIDRFDVEGGTTHDWFLHGSREVTGTLETSIAVETPVATLVPSWGGRGVYKGESDTDLVGTKFHAYDFLREVRSAPAGGAVAATWRYGTPALRTHLFPPPASTLYRFVSPSVRAADEDDANLEKQMSLGLMLRHAGPSSSFLAVHEPFSGTPWITSTTVSDGRVEIRYTPAGGGEVTDTIRFTSGTVTVESTAGWRYDSGVALDARVTALDREGGVFALTLDRAVPPAAFVRVDFPGGPARVYRVRSVDGPRLLLEEDPGFELDAATGKATFLYFPHDSFDGPLTATVFTTADADTSVTTTWPATYK